MGRPICKIYINNDAKMLKRGGGYVKRKKNCWLAGGLLCVSIYQGNKRGATMLICCWVLLFVELSHSFDCFVRFDPGLRSHFFYFVWRMMEDCFSLFQV